MALAQVVLASLMARLRIAVPSGSETSVEQVEDWMDTTKVKPDLSSVILLSDASA